MTAPDVLILRKLEWFRRGGEISESQWRDVIGVIAAQRASLDIGRLRRDADEVGLGELVQRALVEAEDDLT